MVHCGDVIARLVYVYMYCVCVCVCINTRSARVFSSTLKVIYLDTIIQSLKRDSSRRPLTRHAQEGVYVLWRDAPASVTPNGP